jgi:hypothetical protein
MFCILKVKMCLVKTIPKYFKRSTVHSCSHLKKWKILKLAAADASNDIQETKKRLPDKAQSWLQNSFHVCSTTVVSTPACRAE